MVEGTATTGLKQYFIKVVPTLYTDESSILPQYMLTNQYTYTERFRPLMLPDPETGRLTQVLFLEY